MKNILREGFEIERDGQKILITPEEIREIEKYLNALGGQGSLEYYMDTFWEPDEEEQKYMKKAEELLESVDDCAAIWREFIDDLLYDSGEVETNAVNYYIKDLLDKEGENE